MKKFYIVVGILLLVPCLLWSQETATPSSVTFDVDDVEVAQNFLDEVSYQQALEARWGAFEAGSIQPKKLVKVEFMSDGGQYNGMHSLVAALWYCYGEHRSLVLSPDMIWLMICQGFAKHVELNAEQLRDKFVHHKGKKTLVVTRNTFVKGSPNNPWEGVFEEFSLQIKQHVGQANYDLIVAKFSTTGHIEKACFEVSLMDTMKSYFNYQVRTVCGIPSITLEGTPQDWQNLLEKTKNMKGYGLDGWVDELVPILEQFVAASQGKPDKAFWQDIFKIRHLGSGGDVITGWIRTFFPYIQSGEQFVPRGPYGFSQDHFTPGISKVDFVWQYYAQRFNMEFIAGFVGISQHPTTKALRPEIGWIVRDKPAETKPTGDAGEPAGNAEEPAGDTEEPTDDAVEETNNSKEQ